MKSRQQRENRQTTAGLIHRLALLAVLSMFALTVLTGSSALAAAPEVPHNQSRPPGPPLSPEEARGKMVVPQGFRVELVASEPDIVNPVAMTFDSRGRIWLAESVEYPRRSAGKGRDRIKILEDTDGDGKADKFTLFAEGLNIPSGIALGRGGAFVAQAPDLLFLQDTDGDGKADRSEVLLTGFGREDVHELPNSLTWGPDGWLYGLNGVFNPAHIKHQGREHRFTCALWRYHPVTKHFEVFCEGTSNPWGLDYDRQGNFFVSACVIDHLWHLTQSGYYQRQAGAYPPHTWTLGSIVSHRHYKAAYCGLCYYDADAYPAEFRGNLLMGNLHESALNQDAIAPRGASYQATPKPNLLQANDAWFMPVSQKLGPDGFVYIADWYDRFHCYQDALRDPSGVDRGKGRIWRIVYGETKPALPLDLETRADEQLVETLAHPNVWWRREAQRLLVERNREDIKPALLRLALGEQAPGPASRHALWTLISMGPLDEPTHLAVLQHKDSTVRAWGVRAAAGMKRVSPEVQAMLARLAADEQADVRLQVAIAATRLEGADGLGLLLKVLDHAQQDPIIPRIVWQNLHPQIAANSGPVASWLGSASLADNPDGAAVAGRVIEYLLTSENRRIDVVATLLRKSLTPPQAQDGVVARLALKAVVKALLNGELSAAEQRTIRDAAAADIISAMDRQDEAALLATQVLLHWRDAGAMLRAASIIGDPKRPWPQRREMLRMLVAGDDASAAGALREVFARAAPSNVQHDVVAIMGKSKDPTIAPVLLEAWPKVAEDVQPLAIELLSRRKPSAQALLIAVKDGRVPRSAINSNHAGQIAAFKDAELTTLLTNAWGTVRVGRDPQREAVIRRLRGVAQTGRADPVAGQHVYLSRCAQCHKLYGHGGDVGPDLTGVGRTDLDQVLSSVLDPNLVVGAGYRAMHVATTDGRIMSGLPVEDSPSRLVLKISGSETVVIPRSEIEESKYSEVSLMPTGLEEGLSDQQFRDLIGLLLTTQSPGPWPETKPGAVGPTQK